MIRMNGGKYEYSGWERLPEMEMIIPVSVLEQLIESLFNE